MSSPETPTPEPLSLPLSSSPHKKPLKRQRGKQNTVRRDTTCCIVGCGNHRGKSKKRSSADLEFYGFPYYSWQEEKRKEWIKLVKRTNPDGTPWQPQKYSFICSAHFVGNRKSEHPQHPSYLPTIFPPTYHRRPLSKSQVDRLKRIHKRSTEQILTSLQLFKKDSDDKLVDKGKTKKPTATGTADTTSKRKDRIPACKGWQLAGVPSPDRDKAFTSTHSVATQTTKIMIPVTCKTFVEQGIQTDPPTKRKASSELKLTPIANRSLIQCQGFHGIDSINSDEDMKDLTGITLDTFASLLDQLPERGVNAKFSKEDALLIFLMRLNIGLTCSTIRLLFGIDRETVGKVFRKVKSQLSEQSLHQVREEVHKRNVIRYRKRYGAGADLAYMDLDMADW